MWKNNLKLCGLFPSFFHAFYKWIFCRWWIKLIFLTYVDEAFIDSLILALLFMHAYAPHANQFQWILAFLWSLSDKKALFLLVKKNFTIIFIPPLLSFTSLFFLLHFYISIKSPSLSSSSFFSLRYEMNTITRIIMDCLADNWWPNRSSKFGKMKLMLVILWNIKFVSILSNLCNYTLK